jgi:hypothetical protein
VKKKKGLKLPLPGAGNQLGVLFKENGQNEPNFKKVLTILKFDSK